MDAPPTRASAVRPMTTRVRVTEHYRRYGSDVARIEALNGPESTRQTLVVSWDAAGSLVLYDGTLETDDGRVLQRIWLDDQGIEREDVATGKVQVLSTELDQFTATALSARNDLAARAKLDGIAARGRDVSHLNGQTKVTVDVKLPSIRTSTGEIPKNAYTIPYVADLDAVSAYEVATIDDGTGETLDLSTYAVSADGRRTLIERRSVEEDYVTDGGEGQ